MNFLHEIRRCRVKTALSPVSLATRSDDQSASRQLATQIVLIVC